MITSLSTQTQNEGGWRLPAVALPAHGVHVAAQREESGCTWCALFGWKEPIEIVGPVALQVTDSGDGLTDYAAFDRKTGRVLGLIMHLPDATPDAEWCAKTGRWSGPWVPTLLVALQTLIVRSGS